MSATATMSHFTQRRRNALLATVAFLGVFLGFAISPSAVYAAALPDPGSINPSAATELIIHKVEQPEEFGHPATGLPIADTSDLIPVNGATFTATRVPGVELNTPAGWNAATEMTPAQAQTLIANLSPEASGTTGVDGVLSLSLSVGLYYVAETSVPAGVVAADPFLVVLPINNPHEASWLYTVHVYPKNPRVGVSITVDDANAVKLRDTVTWTSRADIPRVEQIDGYVVQNLINPNLDLIDAPDDVVVTLTGTGAPALEPGDYINRIVTVDGRVTIETEFTESGRAKLEAARAANPDASVDITYRTSVLVEGAHINEVRLMPDQRAIEGLTPPVVAETVTKWGPLSVLVYEYGNPTNVIAGARFKFYLTAEDAKAGRNSIVVEGVDEWTTDTEGRLIIDGLRFSNFANGLDRDPSDPLYRVYWAMPTFVPPGWTWVEDEPLAGAVNSVVEFETLIFRVTQGAELPVTGEQMAGMGVALLGAVIVGGGAVLVLRGRRSRGETDTQ